MKLLAAITPLTASVANVAAAIGAASILLAPSFARADYRYDYVSNPFLVTWTAPFDPDLPPVIVDTTLTATVFSPTPLVAGAGLGSGLSFSLTQSAPSYVTETLVYPYPYPPPVDGCGLGTPCYPYNDGTFNIAAVDAAGLPTQWNIGIHYEYAAPTGRHFVRDFMTTSTFDSVSGGYEGFSNFEGSLLDSPGKWTVTAVPEPESYAMLLAGLGLLGVVARKRKTGSLRSY